MQLVLYKVSFRRKPQNKLNEGKRTYRLKKTPNNHLGVGSSPGVKCHSSSGCRQNRVRTAFARPGINPATVFKMFLLFLLLMSTSSPFKLMTFYSPLCPEPSKLLESEGFKIVLPTTAFKADGLSLLLSEISVTSKELLYYHK